MEITVLRKAFHALCPMLLKWIKKQLWLIAGALVGLLSGYLYWQEAGCVSGSCAITSSPVNSTLYGGLMGVLLFSFFKDLMQKSSTN